MDAAEREGAVFALDVFPKLQVETQVQVEPKLQVSKELEFNSFGKEQVGRRESFGAPLDRVINGPCKTLEALLVTSG